tara:strand:+ start:6628 stop:7422 length:795 start_codon:yes stop_codon:yes gene_type:complete
MHKPLVIIGTILALVSIALFAGGANSLGDGIEELDELNIPGYIVDNGTSIEYTYADNDSAGSAGVYVLLEGSYGDNDSDPCENFQFTITDSLGNDVTNDVSTFAESGGKCLDESKVDENVRGILEENGKVIAISVCDTLSRSHRCQLNETYTLAGDQTMHLFDNDALGYDSVGPLFSLIGGVFSAVIGACCGLFGIGMAVTGLLTGRGPKPMPGATLQSYKIPPPITAANPSPSVEQTPTTPPVEIGTDIEAEKVAITPVSVWD